MSRFHGTLAAFRPTRLSGKRMKHLVSASVRVSTVVRTLAVFHLANVYICSHIYSRRAHVECDAR